MNKVIMTVITMIIILSAAVNAIAATYDLKTITPEIQQALDARRGRFGELQSLKAQGIIGENRSGYVEALSQNASATAIVNAENADRKLIYRAIADQNNLTGAIATIEAVFADVQRAKAQPGERVQLANGTWVTK